MGIRYYAYAFESDMIEQALANPRHFLPSDPLADAWGMEAGVAIGAPTFKQSTPESDLLYFDKAWSDLRRAIGLPGRPARRMLEGEVLLLDDYGWEPVLKVITPQEAADIARDMEGIEEEEVEIALRSNWAAMSVETEDVSHVMSYFHRAREYVMGVAAAGRGFVYMIG